MLGLLNILMGRPSGENEKSAVLSRLQKQAQKSEESSGNRDDISDLDVLNHKHRAVLLSKDLGTERDRWPKMRTQNSMNSANGADGFWERTVGSQSESVKHKAQILGSMRTSGLV